MSDDAKDSAPHPDYPGMTRGEVAKAQARARSRLESDRSKAALAKIEDAEYDRLQREEGISTEEMVEISLNLAPDMKDLRIDGKIYANGYRGAVKASLARDMLYMQWKGWLNESARLGEDRYAFYAQKAQTTKAPIVINGRNSIASGALPAGTHG
jgi:hypothetical protein